MVYFYLRHPFRFLLLLLSIPFAVGGLYSLLSQLDLINQPAAFLIPFAIFGILKALFPTRKATGSDKIGWWVEFRSSVQDLPSVLVWLYPLFLLLGGVALLLLSFWFFPSTLSPFPPSRLQDRPSLHYPAILGLILLFWFYTLPLFPPSTYSYSEQNEKEGRWEEGGVSYLIELQNYFVMDFHSARYLHGKRFGEQELDKYWQTEPREWYRGVRIVGVGELIPVAGPLSTRYRNWVEDRRVEEENLTGKKIPRSPFYARPTWEFHLQKEEAQLREKERIELLKSRGLWNEAEEREKKRIEKELEDSWELLLKSSPTWRGPTT